MINLNKKIKKFFHQEHGVSTIEYGIIAALIAVSAIGAATTLGSNNSQLYCTISRSLGSSATCGSNLADKSYRTPEQGGTLNKADTVAVGHIELPKLTLAVLESINAKDKITGIYGVYQDNMEGNATNAISTLSDMEALGKESFPSWSTTNGLNEDTPGGTGLFQVVTASGQVYTINGIDQNGVLEDGSSTPDSRSFYETVTNSSGKVVETSSVQGYGTRSVTQGTFTG